MDFEIKHKTIKLNQHVFKISNLWIVLPMKYTKLNVQQTNMISRYLPQVRHSPVLEGLVAAVVDIAVKVGGRVLGDDVTDVAQQHRLLPSRLQVSQKPTHQA